MKKYTKQENSWIFYDWANSAYSIIITTAVFPLYYKAVATDAGVSLSNSTAYLGLLGCHCDIHFGDDWSDIRGDCGLRRIKEEVFLVFLPDGDSLDSFVGICAGDNWLWLLIIYTITAVGFHGANIFYDAFLVDVTPEERMNRVSARGFGLGYIGSTIPFMISIAIIIIGRKRSDSTCGDATASKLAFVITAIWWFVFTIPMLKNVHQLHGIKREPNILGGSFRRLGGTFKEIRKYRTVFLFLLAYFFYIDGVGTIINMSTAYGTDLGISCDKSSNYFVCHTSCGCAIFNSLREAGAEVYRKKMLYVGICVYIVVCIYAYFMKTTMDFWILAMLVATSQGGIQALSRSYFARIVPKEKANRVFRFL